ncbi:MAG: hypothetical protein AAF848_00155 [Pseudomonadota bacterium]
MKAVRATLVLGLVLLLAACAVEEGATAVEIASKRYVSVENPYIEIVSMVERRSERAAHTAMIINASQRVIYDPAGTFQHEDLVERGDIHYGANDRMVSYYERYHARFSHYVHVQRIVVSAEVAERVLKRAQAQGPSPKMFCAVHAASVLNDSLGTSFARSFFPEDLRRSVARMPGVIDRYRYEEDRTKAVPTGA